MLQQNRVKQGLAEGAVQIGVLQSFSAAAITEIIGHVGYDFVMADGEHSPFDHHDMEHLARTAEVTGMTPLVRVPGTDRRDICRYLDAGAAGVIVPNVRTRAEVENALAATAYPPAGNRGLALPRASGFGAMPLPEFVDFANDNTLRVIQIETLEALDNLDDILSVPGVDVAFMGPLDVSAVLGVVGQVDHPEVVAIRRQISESCARHGVVAGTFAFTPEQLTSYVDEGFRFFLLGVDFLFLRQAASAALSAARSAVAE